MVRAHMALTGLAVVILAGGLVDKPGQGQQLAAKDAEAAAAWTRMAFEPLIRRCSWSGIWNVGSRVVSPFDNGSLVFNPSHWDLSDIPVPVGQTGVPPNIAPGLAVQNDIRLLSIAFSCRAERGFMGALPPHENSLSHSGQTFPQALDGTCNTLGTERLPTRVVPFTDTGLAIYGYSRECWR